MIEVYASKLAKFLEKAVGTGKTPLSLTIDKTGLHILQSLSNNLGSVKAHMSLEDSTMLTYKEEEPVVINVLNAKNFIDPLKTFEQVKILVKEAEGSLFLSDASRLFEIPISDADLIQGVGVDTFGDTSKYSFRMKFLAMAQLIEDIGLVNAQKIRVEKSAERLQFIVGHGQKMKVVHFVNEKSSETFSFSLNALTFKDVISNFKGDEIEFGFKEGSPLFIRWSTETSYVQVLLALRDEFTIEEV